MRLFPASSRASGLLVPILLGVQALHADVALNVSVDPSAGRAPISPYIYGTNQDLPGVVNTARRLGGNRMTGYNWETNASNAGSDYLQSSDNFLTWSAGIPTAQENIPGIVATHFHDQSLAAGTPYSVVTLPMAGYVSADKNGTVATSEAAPSVRWKAIQNNKPSALATTPDTTDGVVYSDEFINLLVSKYGKASSSTGIKGYDLDNEPDLWSSTHPRLHPAQPTCVELVSRTVDLAKTVKRIDSSAETLGFVSYGFGGYYNFQGAPDWATEKTKGPYAWFIDYFLDQMKNASNSAGTRLLDVLDVHNYSEATAGGVRVNNPSTWENIDCNKGRIQAPRSLWDPSYVENSWIGTWFSSFLPFIPKLQGSINTFYPGTKLSITEYNFGGESHISGGLAEADTLGIFGQQGVYLASWWPLHDNPTYIAAAFKLFLNYNGAGGKFGTTKVSASTSDNANGSAYASIEDSTGSKLHLVVLNKNYDQASAVTIHIAGSTNYTSARVFAFDSTSATITERAPVSSITGNTFTYSLPALTAAHLVLTAGGNTPPPVAPTITTQPSALTVATGASATFSVVATGTGPLSYQWNKNGAALSGATSTSLTLSNAQSSDAGTYSVTVSNTAGTVTSSGALLTVTPTPPPPPPVAPTITTQPSAVTVAAGASATFSVVATGTGPLSYQWSKNGAALSGATSASLTLTNVQLANAGIYSVTVSNTAGAVTSSGAQLTVTSPPPPPPVAPTITTQPSAVTVAVGASATFSVAATGTGPLSYQWSKNGAALSGATSASLTLTNVQLANAGIYSVTVSNTAGTVTSSGAQLTVTSPPPPPPPPPTVYPAENALRSGTGTVLETIHPGFHGTGYVNFPTNGGTLTFNNVNGGSGGLKTVIIRFALGVKTARTGKIVVNGVSSSITFQPTGAWTTWSTLTVTKAFLSGTANTIQLKSTGGDLANIDEITVQ